jgi:hypothetical protein
MLKFITPDDTKSQTEEEFWEAMDEHYAHDHVYKLMKSFILAAKEAHRSMRQVIHYTFEKSVFGKVGVDARKLLFLDPAYPDRRPIGAVMYVSYQEQYEVYNRNTTVSRGDRYKKMRADRTKDLKKAVSILKKQVTLYANEEVADLSYGEAYDALIGWLAEINVPSSLLQHEEHVEEISNLVQQGATFKTETYRNAVEHLPSAIEKFRRRGIANYEMVYVAEIKNSGLVVGRKGWGTVYKYESLEQLPEVLLGKFSLLRIMPPSTHLPEVGYRTADGVSWLFGIGREEWAGVVAGKSS